MLRALAVVLLMSCGDSTPKGDPSPDKSAVAADAGKVRELAGKVTATRGATTRTLAVGNPVGADEVIDTGADGSVVIELVHNNALWSIESGIKARVDQSVAWGLPKQEVAKSVEHATSSAGRHADRQAADTQVTAAELAKPPEAEAPPDVPAAPPPPAKTAPSTIAPPPKPARPRDPPSPKPAVGGEGCDEVACVLEPERSCCARYKKSPSSNKKPADSAGLPDVPARQAISDGVTKLKERIRACGKTAAKGTLKIVFKVAADGTVTNAEVKQSPDPAIDQCVIDVAKTLKLPRSRLGVTFTYPIVID